MSDSLPRVMSDDEKRYLALLKWLSFTREVDVIEDWDGIYPTNDDVVESFLRDTHQLNLLKTNEAERLSEFFAWVSDGEVVEFSPEGRDICRVVFAGGKELAEYLVLVQYPRDVADGAT